MPCFLSHVLTILACCTCLALNPQASALYDYYHEPNHRAEQPAAPCKPHQVHLSFGNSIHDFNIVWATAEKCISQVKFGPTAWQLHSEVPASYNNFLEQNYFGQQHLYRAKLQHLLPETMYYYMAVSNESYSRIFYFQTPPAGNKWSPDFLMFGDLGIHSNTTPSLINEAFSGNYTALFHVGDFAYDLHAQNGLLGDYFMELIEPVAAYIPYMTCPGNHEINQGTFAHYRNRFAMPGSNWPIPLDGMWYSMDIGPVHFVSYSSEVFFTHFGQYVDVQRQWLVSDLGNVSREKTPWVVAYGHRPMYCSTKIGDDCSLRFSRVRAGLEDIFVEFQVDLIIQAHEHNYERLWPVYKWKVGPKSYINPPLPVQIITGAAGSIERTDHFPTLKPEWSAFRLDEAALNSYGRLLVKNLSHLYWEQRSIDNHTILDSIWIVKNTKTTSPPSYKFVVVVVVSCTVLAALLLINCALYIGLLLKQYNKHTCMFPRLTPYTRLTSLETGPSHGGMSVADQT
ncbi:acid phosphatase type 7-like [Physella acuta]|uniref:acid phosphatase type 7-like n=1 Tax=Physella acuta TaxID=109671 RepID=UPI0027DBCB92|nr:acid phosphatase type 7-like [Physella acuta]XP_059144641.1 acid phosphatase type 7-like [Physella acuta]XP_059144646.1 acid phosphatase type 7-like [Physella acuta]XP_059144650.1 acid phosphatase type 7-like [Physella acuta]XP_059144659.1 acid phosphatase type 7-like [Physella acuta]XP_059144668.1 acid phosphatase type 7-like [Physella acuta]